MKNFQQPNNTTMIYTLNNGITGKFCCYAETYDGAVMKLKKWYNKRDMERKWKIIDIKVAFAELFDVDEAEDARIFQKHEEQEQAREPEKEIVKVVESVEKIEPIPLWIKMEATSALILAILAIVGSVCLW